MGFNETGDQMDLRTLYYAIRDAVRFVHRKVGTTHPMLPEPAAAPSHCHLKAAGHGARNTAASLRGKSADRQRHHSLHLSPLRGREGSGALTGSAPA
jgi:hypothetical protein